MVNVQNFVFFDGATATATSNPVINNNCDVLSIQVSGTYTSATVLVQGKTDREAEYVTLAAIDMSTLRPVRDGLITNGIYEFGIEGIQEIQAEISAFSGTDISVFGKLSNTGV